MLYNGPDVTMENKMDFLKNLGQLSFPKPNDIIINMMPFIMGDATSIPEEYVQYGSIIEACELPNEELGKVGYLTINESFVEKLNSQRRPGIHTEKHSEGGWGGGWGGSEGGLYMSSNLSDSCRAWNHYVDNPGPHGDCEYLRDSLPESINMEANHLYWMTDGTPHEALLLEQVAHRQFFRLVTNEIFGWYAQHSTPNRLGVKPDCKVLTHNKFETIGQ